MQSRSYYSVGFAGLMAGLAILVGCTQSTTSTSWPKVPIPGGYAEASKSDPEVVSAAEFAVADQSLLGPKLKLISIQGAGRQVVAGTNIHLAMIVETAGSAKPVEAVVYTDLNSVRSVVAWAWLPTNVVR